jgi:hypothetical protein
MRNGMRRLITTPASPQERRRRWKQWTAFGILVVAGSAVLLFRQPPEVVRARQVTLGMTRWDVEKVFGGRGHPGWYVTPDNGLIAGQAYHRWSQLTNGIRKLLRIPTVGSYDDWPVHITFDANGCVCRIKRGSEVVEAPAASRVK